jgi:hypothetical protein
MALSQAAATQRQSVPCGCADADVVDVVDVVDIVDIVELGGVVMHCTKSPTVPTSP